MRVSLDVDGAAAAVAVFSDEVSLQPLGCDAVARYREHRWASDHRLLSDEDTIETGSRTLRFRRPHPWSPAAVIEVALGRREPSEPTHLLLAAGPVIMGPNADSHVRVDAAETVVLFRRDGGLMWKRLSGPLDAEPVNRLSLPSFIETDTLRCRVQSLD